jgi:hypothetical protein
MNPLSRTTVAASTGSNPLAGGGLQQAQMQAQPQPSFAQLTPDQVDQHLSLAAWMVPALGSLAKRKDLTRKDVLLEVSNAVSHGKIPVSAAASFMSQLPEDRAQLRQFLDTLYRQNLAAAVHLHLVRQVRGAAA